MSRNACAAPSPRVAERIVSAADGTTLSTVEGDHLGDGFGNAVAAVGDLDLDGIADYVVGAPGVDRQGSQSGAVFLISGADGSEIYECDGGNPNDCLGISVAALGDVDGDGVGDFVAGSMNGYASMYSGSTGRLLSVLSSSKPSTGYAILVAGGGDLDGDGVPDVAVGDLASSLGSRAGGSVSLFSGASGKVIYEIGSTTPAALFGVVQFTEDVDADGTADLIVGAPLDSTVATSGGSAWVYSGRSGALLTGFAPGFAGTPSADRGTVFLMSGRDGGMLYHFEEPAGTQYGLGSVIAKPRDLDGDGVQDFVFAAPSASTSTLDMCGDVSIWKGRMLWVDAFPRTVKPGQPETLSIGEMRQYGPYVLVLRGLNGVPYFTIVAINSFDAAGRATLSGNVPPGLGGYAIDLQAITFDYQGDLLWSGIETLTM